MPNVAIRRAQRPRPERCFASIAAPPRSRVSNLENSSIGASKILDLLSLRLPMVNSTENITGSPENSKCFSRTREFEKIYTKMIEISNRLIIKFY